MTPLASGHYYGSGVHAHEQVWSTWPDSWAEHRNKFANNERDIPPPTLQRLSRLYYQVVTPPAPRRSFQPRLPTQCLSYLSSELSTSLDRTWRMTMSVILSPSRRATCMPPTLGFPRRSPTTRVLPNLPSPVRRPSWPLLELFHRHRTRGPEVKSQAYVREHRHGLRPILPWPLCRYTRQS